MKIAYSRRQSLRRTCILVALLLFPITINYFSPYLIIDSASVGIINGSLIVFTAMFMGSLLLGRLWCAWGCPMAGLGEVCMTINPRPVGGRWVNAIKWVIWVIWIGVIFAMVVSAGGYRGINFFYMTDSYISVDRAAGYIIYYTVLAIFLTLSLTVGRRAGCHSICWMSPFMILGRKLSNRAQLPALRLQADASACKDCKLCTRNCPMSLDVNAMVQRENMENSECILCGTCVDDCASRAIRYTFATPAGK